MANYEYEVTVIGGGPGGYVAAIKAAQLGKKTCLVEGANIGGVCLNEGCIPTKTLIQTANVFHQVKHAANFAVEGVEADKLSVAMDKLQQRRAAVVNQLVGGVTGLLRANKVTVVKGMAHFTDEHTVTAGDETITSENFIIATGSSTFMPPFIAQEGQNNMLTSREALLLDKVPESIAVIGGGVIGIEFAYLLNKLGSRVTVVELMDQILPMVDTEIAKMAQKRLEKDGVTFFLGAKVEKVKDNTVYFEQGGEAKTVAAAAVLMAVGRTPNTEGLGAEEIGVVFDKKAIATDAYLRTNLSHIYAIGDVNGKFMLAHTASHEGITAVKNICGEVCEMHYNAIPSCIYLEPELACIGISEAAAKEQYQNVKVGRFPMMGNGKSLVGGDTDGAIKVILNGDDDEILGVHMYGLHTTDMVAEIAVAMTNELSAEEVIESIHPHPTVSEAVSEAFMAAAYGKAIHFL